MNVFRKADRTLNKWKFLFHLKLKTNSLTLRKYNSHLQYYKIDLNSSIKLQEINYDVCKEYKTETFYYLFLTVELLKFKKNISVHFEITSSHERYMVQVNINVSDQKYRIMSVLLITS